MTEPVKNLNRAKTEWKWAFVAVGFIAVLIIMQFAYGSLSFTKPVDTERQFADQAMDSARDAMKDPTSVKFKDLTVNSKNRCMYGEILARNSYGAYTGYQSFVWVDGATYIDPGTVQSNIIIDNTGDFISYMKARSRCLSPYSNHDGYVPLTIPEA